RHEAATDFCRDNTSSLSDVAVHITRVRRASTSALGDDSRRARGAPMRSGPRSLMRVLIVDDSRLARITLRKALPASLSTEVVEAANGDEALAGGTLSPGGR